MRSGPLEVFCVYLVRFWVIPSTASQLPHPAESRAHPHLAKHEDGEVNLSDILNFFRGIAAQAQGTAGGAVCL